MYKLIGAAALLLAAGTASAADQPIDAFEAGQQAAWNAHDAAAYTAAFDSDAGIITALGWRWAGQVEAARNLGDGFKLVYAQARMQVSDVQFRMLTPDLALVTLSLSIAGARTVDGGQPSAEQHGVETQLLQRHSESWRILSQQDTATAASAPSPASPSSSSPQTPERATPPVPTFPTAPPPIRRCIVGRANGQCLIYGKPAKAPPS